MSLGVTVATVAVSLTFAFLAALAVTRFRFRGRKAFIVTLLLIQMIPVEGLFISQYKMLEGFNLLNTIAGLTLVYVANVLPFTVWTLRGFVAGVPYELEEAAMMDGCSRFQAFRKITFPLLAPGPGGHRRLRLHPGVERVHARRGRDDPRGLEDAARLAGELPRRQPRHRLGRRDGRLDADRGAGDHLLPPRPGPDGLGAHRRGGEGDDRSSTNPWPCGCCCRRSTGRRCRPTCSCCSRRGWAGCACSAPTPPTARTRSRRTPPTCAPCRPAP